MPSRCYYSYPNPSFGRKPESRRSSIWIAAAVAVLTLAFSNIAHAEKIRTAIPQANLNYLSIHVADARSFFKDEGLNNETVVISGPLSIAALLSGLPTPEGVKNFLEYDIKIPLQIKDDIPPERLLNLQLVENVKKELEATQRRTTK